MVTQVLSCVQYQGYVFITLGELILSKELPAHVDVYGYIFRDVIAGSKVASPDNNPPYDTKRLMLFHLMIHQKLRKRRFNQSVWDARIFRLAKNFCGFVFAFLVFSFINETLV